MVKGDSCATLAEHRSPLQHSRHGHLDTSCGLGREYQKIEQSARILHLMMFKFAWRPAARLVERDTTRLCAMAKQEIGLPQGLVDKMERT